MGLINEVNIFITAGADVNAADRYGKTPLYCAATKGHDNVAKLLAAAQLNEDW